MPEIQEAALPVLQIQYLEGVAAESRRGSIDILAVPVSPLIPLHLQYILQRAAQEPVRALNLAARECE